MSEDDWTDPSLDPVVAAREYLDQCQRNAQYSSVPPALLVERLTWMCERLSDELASNARVYHSGEWHRQHIMRTARHPDGSRVWPEVE